MYLQLLALLRKEWLLNIKKPELYISTIFFCITILLIFNFTQSSDAQDPSQAGVYWITFFLGGIIGLNRSLILDKTNGCLEAILAAPITPTCLFLSKIIGNALFLLVAQLTLIPIYALFFEERLWEVLLLFYPLCVLVTLGFSAVGTLASALVAELRFQEVLLPLLLFPLLIPLLLCAISLTDAIILQEDIFRSDWLKLLAIYDLIFFAASYLLYEFVVGSA